MTNELGLTNVINVTVQSTPSLLGVVNINTCALFSLETPSWTGVADYKIYTDPTTVGTDFGSSSNAFKIATAFFAQQPNPLQTNGYLVIIPRTLVPLTEDVKDAIIRTTDKVYYFGILVDELISSGTFDLLTDYVQSIDKMLFYASNIVGDYAPGGMLDLLRTGTKTHSRGLYFSDGTAINTQCMAGAYAGRALSTDFEGSLTCQTMHLKALSGVAVDTTVDQTALTACQTAGVDVYVSVAGVPCVFTSGANSFFDEIYNEFWLKFALQTAGFNYLRGTNTKIPQTESGMEGLKNTYRKICQQAVTNGFSAPGTWDSPNVFGNPESLIRSVKDIGYYVYSQPIAQQSTASRTARTAPLVQIAIKTAGAIHKSNVLVNVNL